jgi:hypothetical protein
LGVYEFKRGFGGELTTKFDYLKFNSLLYRIAEFAYRKTTVLPFWGWFARCTVGWGVPLGLETHGPIV